jgi:hypothetical protein
MTSRSLQIAGIILSALTFVFFLGLKGPEIPSRTVAGRSPSLNRQTNASPAPKRPLEPRVCPTAAQL